MTHAAGRSTHGQGAIGYAHASGHYDSAICLRERPAVDAMRRLLTPRSMVRLDVCRSRRLCLASGAPSGSASSATPDSRHMRYSLKAPTPTERSSTCVPVSQDPLLLRRVDAVPREVLVRWLLRHPATGLHPC